MSRNRLALIQYKILNDLYVLNPLRLKFINDTFIVIRYRTDIMIGADRNDSNILTVVMPSSEEDLFY